MPFEIFQSEKTNKYHFRLKAGNGEVILQSQAYESKAGAQKGVQSVVNHAGNENNFEQKTATNGQEYFVLKAANGEVIGRSEMYKSKSGAENGISSVQKNAAEDTVKDLTT